MHAVALAGELGIREVVVPRGASVFSAWGMMMSDLRRDYFVTRLIGDGEGAARALSAVVEDTKSRARAQYGVEGIDPERVRMTVLVKCRYQNQEHAVEVDLGADTVTAETMHSMMDRFHAVYEREYTYRLAAPVEIVGIHLIASAEVGKLELLELPKTGASLTAALRGRREVDYALEGIHMAEVYDAEKLEPGMGFAGPAVIEDPDTTIVIHPGNAVRVDAYGNIHIAV
jgi:N-methylhydantoinase A